MTSAIPGFILRVLIVTVLAAALPAGTLSFAQAGTDIQLRPGGCVDAECHGDYSRDKYTHSPVLLNKCNACHETLENRHAFKLTAASPEMCTFCHKMKLDTFVHKPLAEGKCLDCHNPHSSRYPQLLKSDPAKTLCTSCHKPEDLFAGMRYLHAPVAQGACILCHRGHSSKNDKLVTEGGKDLCLFCHRDEFGPLLEQRHVHKPVLEDCQKCHDPHGSNNPMLIAKKEPEFCYDCHEDIARLIKNSKNVHEAILTKKSCSNCHAAHASARPRLLEKPMIDVCLSCHNEEIEDKNGKLLQNIGKLLKDNPFKHGPIRQDNCVACHNPHASNVFRQLVSFFPEHFYAPFDVKEYNLCFQCHTRDAFLLERTTALTNFRDGDLNLHFLHVNKAQKGRTCRACHEIHASSQEAHVRSKVPYGDWEFPVVFTAGPAGGTCSAGCHDKKSYSRKYKKIEPGQ